MVTSNPILKKKEESELCFITPVPSLVLTVFYNNKASHITIDNGATSNYVLHSYARSMKFPIYPNGQMSLLGDRKTALPAVGEINIVFHRDNWSVRFHALVVDDLGADM